MKKLFFNQVNISRVWQLLSILIILSFSTISYTQIKCGWDVSKEKLFQNDKHYKNYSNAQRNIDSYLNSYIENRSSSSTIYQIPVVFNIVLENPNSISNEDIMILIQNLNNDFRPSNWEILLVPEPFQEFVADTRFRFYLADVPGTCNGITRRKYTGLPFTMSDNFMKFTNTGGINAIDPEHILNIWICELHNFPSGIAGYTQPLGGPIETDGVVLNSKYLNIYSKTLTHEVGHYFNLEHIWGSAGITWSCSDTDYVDDTPNQSGPTLTTYCPSFPLHDECEGGPHGIMFMNFMDYTPDHCLQMFTNGQKERMHACLFTYRIGLLQQNYGEGNFFTALIENENPTCLLDNGSLKAVGIGGVQPYSYEWSNGQTTRSIFNLSPGTYSVTIYDQNGCSASTVYELQSEILVNNALFKWSDVVSFYGFSNNKLENRSIYVEDRLIIDIDYEFQNVDFSFSPNSYLIVNNNITLNITGNSNKYSVFKGCQGDWIGLITDESSKLTLKYIDIVGAITGINCNKSHLDLEFVSISGNNGDYAIKADKSNFLKLRYIEIDNYKTGIQSKNANVFPNMSYGIISNSKDGIVLEQSTSKIEFFNIEATNNCVLIKASPLSIFVHNSFNTESTKGKVGIKAINSENSVFNKNRSGEYNLNTFISVLNCSYSEISNYVAASDLGIEVVSSNSVSIYRNNIRIPPSRFSIAGGVRLINVSDSNIEKNTMVTNNGNSFGVHSNVSNSNNIIDNTFSYTSAAVFPHRKGVIRTTGSHNEIIDNNQINGPGNIHGIFVNNSYGNTFSCNEISGASDGLGIFFNSTFHDIKGNKFLNCGPDLIIRSVIGPQYYKGNEFYNGNCRAEGLTDNEILQSMFFVNQNIPYHMPSNPIPGNNQWFRHDGDELSYFDDCPKDIGGGRTGFDEVSVLNAHFDDLNSQRLLFPERFFVNMMHLLLYEHARKDYSLPPYIAEDPVWSGLTEWQELASAINSLSDISKLSGQSQLTQTDLDNLRLLQTAYAEAEDEGTRKLIYDQLNVLMSDLKPAFDAERLLDSIAINQLKFRFENLKGKNDQMVGKWADIYSMYIDFLQTGEVVEENKTQLLTYSMLCADKYGDAIHLARVLANTFDNTYFDVYDDCPEEKIWPRTGKPGTINAMVNPNPTSGEFSIHFETVVSGSVEVFDISGKSIYSDRLKDAIDYRLKLNVKNGIYLVSVISDSGEIFDEKIVVSK